MDANKTRQLVNHEWDTTILPNLEEYIKIPNQSPAFDPDVLKNGLQDKAVDLIVKWINSQNIHGAKTVVHTHEGKTPIILTTIDANDGSLSHKNPCLLYGHMDKQPPLLPWAEGLHPYNPVIKDGKLYGRGGADDGYASFAALTCVKAIQSQGLKHGRIILLVEACEESGSPDLPFWIDRLAPQLGNIGFVICLDSGCGNYEQFWLTTSLRGVLSFNLKVQVLDEGVHSGSGSGIIPDSFRICRNLLDRIEDSNTGELKVPELFAEVPRKRVQECSESSETLGESIYKEFPFHGSTRPVLKENSALLLAKTWQPKLTIVGCEGIPDLKGGNVLRTHTTLKLSIRIPPGVDKERAGKAVIDILSHNPPYETGVSVTMTAGANGWSSPILENWLEDSVNHASHAFYGKPSRSYGEGGTIPFMNMLGVKFPQAQFVITGLLGPKSNAHGPNEFLHIDFAKNLNCAVSHILYDYFNHH